MDTRETFDAIVPQLIRRGLPQDYARRAAAEFADHHRDLIRELQAGGSNESQTFKEAARRLGDTRALVKKTVREYQRRHWCGRWPLVTFLLGPIPLLLLSWVAITFALLAICWLLSNFGLIAMDAIDGSPSTSQSVAIRLWFALLAFAVPAVTMFALVRSARRAALGWKWPLLSACVLGVILGMLRCQLHPASIEFLSAFNKFQRFNYPTIAFGIPGYSYPTSLTWMWFTYDVQQICQVLLPLAMAAAMVMLAERTSRQASRLAHSCG